MWSPNGRRLLYLRGVDDEVEDDLWVMGSGGGQKRLVLRGNDVRGYMDMSWSPDGTRLLFFAWEEGSHNVPDYDLFSIRPNGSGLRRLTSTPNLNEYGATWSPDGKHIAYTRSSRACTSSVVIAAPDVTQAHRVPIGCAAGNPDWAPGGHRLVVEMSGPRHRDNIVLTRLDGSHRKVVGRGYAPAWQPR